MADEREVGFIPEWWFEGFPCPGPAGSWPCSLAFGHEGDHAPVEVIPEREIPY